MAKKTKKSALRTLHGALKGLLEDVSRSSITKPDKKRGRPKGSTNKAKQIDKLRNEPAKRDGVLYIMSRENMLIPKLTDDEVMERHKKADITMKTVWTNIIEKYEAVENQGDLIDLRTGSIIEDNGHIRGLTHVGNKVDSSTTYKNSLEDILPLDDRESDRRALDNDQDTSFWDEDSNSSASDSSGEISEGSEILEGSEISERVEKSREDSERKNKVSPMD